MYKRILNMKPKVPESHQENTHKIELFRAAVTGYQWAKEPLSRVATAGISFQQLYSELKISVQLERKGAATIAVSS